MRRILGPLTLATVLLTLVSAPIAGSEGGGHRDWPGADPAAPAGAAPVIDLSDPPARSAPAGADLSNVIDTTDRAAVRRAFRDRFLPSITVRTGWTGSVSGCRKGDTSDRYKRAALRLVNYYRGLAGLSAVVFRDAFSSRSQAAALIFHANDALSHAPPRRWRCWTRAGREGAGHSNICICGGTAGHLEGYITDPGASNRSVGHRRWILFPPQRVMGVGATTRANALWVVDQDTWENADTDPEWVPWPPRGFIPTRHVRGRFSLQHPYADFSDAKVSVRIDGRVTAARVVARDAYYGGSAIVFQPDLDRLFASDPRKDHVIRIRVRDIRVDDQVVAHAWSITTFYAYPR